MPSLELAALIFLTDAMPRRQPHIRKRSKWPLALSLVAAALLSGCLALPSLEVDTNIEALLTLRDAQGHSRLGFGVRRDGALGLTVFNRHGKPWVGIGAEHNGALGLALFDAEGMPGLAFGASRYGALGSALLNDRRQTRPIIGLSREGTIAIP